MDKQGIINELKGLGFENATKSTNGCWVNRLNSIICFEAQYFGKYHHCYILAYKENRIAIHSVKELNSNYNKLKKKTL